MDVKISSLEKGDMAEVVGYEKCERSYRDKLLSMGLTKGVQFTVVKFAPLGDPIDIKVRGYNLSLRKAEAEILLLKKVED